ncbi:MULTISPECIES: hypothetical protein [Dickeya]|uniref:Uncharacterized protein n=1 Tax=Dickeya fangzhongdai TaxID=1778540 RepID=A0A2K8QMT0_9GAMM|nr:MULTISPECIES: hypothetical protein [Dickeya]ATZ94794.1 hypothetical protein CVE23_12880 [Dickeya fangzhongdai]AYH48498.1 hypothetical protein B6N31_12820 [Dickeya fangzhongdai]MBO8134499.1 hypothetical protein [Dickeya fangzhongdai]QOH48235.1 hypothetical protein DYD82_12945 [Dickeya fangzhongdai]QOH52538.1 hypothetical protein DYD83_12945 [Dickeya fangzhongdai]
MEEAHSGPAGSSESERMCIDYTAYLGALCRKRWRFIDALYGVMPIFGMVTKSPVVAGSAGKDKLLELAMQVLSTQASDETNLSRLITLARQQGVTELDIRLPYALSGEQLQAIGQACRDHELALSQHAECLTVRSATSTAPSGLLC